MTTPNLAMDERYLLSKIRNRPLGRLVSESTQIGYRGSRMGILIAACARRRIDASWQMHRTTRRTARPRATRLQDYLLGGGLEAAIREIPPI